MDKILVVDDEPNIRASLEEILTGDGYLVTAVESGEAALEALESETFDLALLDLKLTGMGGIDVLKGLRERALDTVVIVLTAHASMETAIEALRQGAHDYLFKPCRPAELRESIQRGLVNRHENEQQDLQRQLEHMASSLEDIHLWMWHLYSLAGDIFLESTRIICRKAEGLENDSLEEKLSAVDSKAKQLFWGELVTVGRNGRTGSV